MAKTAIGFGLALAVLGVAGYVGTDMVSKTALIPSGFGVLLVILGAVALNPDRRKHAMHVAAMVGLLGILGSASRVPAAIQVLSGQEVARPAASIASGIMFVLCLVFVVLCVKSFVDARRSRAI